MTWAAGLFLVVGFVAVAVLARVPRYATEVMARSRQALVDLKDPGLDDLAREKAVQAHALRLMLLFVLVTLGVAVSLAVPVGLLWLAEQGGLLDFEAVLVTALSPAFLVVSTLLGFLIWGLRRRTGA